MASIFTYSNGDTSQSIHTTITSSSYSGYVPVGESLVSVIVGSNVISIGTDAFKDATSLSSVTFEEGSQLTSIGGRAFRNTALTSITIPASVVSIGDSAFYYATSLSLVSLFEAGSQLKSIGVAAFYGASSLTSITIPASVTSLGSSIFNASSLASVTFEAGSQLTSIGDDVFRDASSLSSITIPESVTSIGARAFQNASSLISITIPAGVNSIGNGAFYLASSLTSIIIPASVTSIGNYAFSGASSLSSVTFEENSQLTSIGDEAFLGASSLTTITIPESVNSIVSNAFLESGLSTVYIADGQEINGTSITSPSTGTVTFFGATNVNIYQVGNEPEPQLGSSVSVVPICFPGGTPVMTNKGEVAIEKLNPDIHKICGKKIVAITEAKPLFKYIIRIEKNALGKNVPNRRTEISKDHEVFYKGKMIRSEELVEKCEGVYRIKYEGETLYNVLMEKHDMMMINNLICETLHPSNIMAKLCRGKYTEIEKKKIISVLNKALKKNDLEGCKRIYKSL